MCSTCMQGLRIQVILMVIVASQMLLPQSTASKFPPGACEYCTVVVGNTNSYVLLSVKIL